MLIRLLFLPTLAWNLILHRLLPRRWWDRIDEHVILGALPFAGDAPKMKLEGVGAVVNLCAEYRGPEAAYRLAGIEQLRLPTTDFSPPALADIERAVEFIREQAAQGRTVYVHCKAGRGRAAAVVLCYLMAAKGLRPAEAEALIRAQRPHVRRDLVQSRVIQEFAQRHGWPSLPSPT
jgi:atypical dual specificity phosphatase